MNLYILLPAFNEEKDLEKLVKSLAGTLQRFNQSYTVVVVDDGSRDRTPKIAEELARICPMKLIQHSQNKGYGAAIHTGFSWVLSQGQDDDVLITMDCDNTHPPDYIDSMTSQIRRGYEMVIASRYQKGGGQVGFSLRRKFFSRSANSLLRTLFPISGVRDYTSGYRAYKIALLRRAKEHYGEGFIESRGFTVPMEILLKLRPMGVRVREIPLMLRYDLKNGTSKMKAIKTILAYLEVMRFLKRKEII